MSLTSLLKNKNKNHSRNLFMTYRELLQFFISIKACILILRLIIPFQTPFDQVCLKSIFTSPSSSFPTALRHTKTPEKHLRLSLLNQVVSSVFKVKINGNVVARSSKLVNLIWSK